MPECKEQIVSQSYGDFIIEYGGDVALVRTRYNTQCVQIVDVNYVIIHTPVERMNQIGDFLYNSIPKLYGLMDTTNLESSGILRVQNNPYLNLRGKDVLVGVIDTGIDYTHPAFLNADGTTRIYSIWDQSIDTGEPPVNFQYGTEYTNVMIDQALASDQPLTIVPSTDDNGHGTFMAGVAAGNFIPGQDFSGAAPEADIAVVKLKPAKNYLRGYYFIPPEVPAYQENDIMMAIAYFRQMAARVRKPLSIVIGLGTNSGDHSGNSYLSNYMNYVGNLIAICICAPCGNEANRATHYYGRTVEQGGYEDVEVRVSDEEEGFIVELWGQVPDVFSVGFRSPGGESIERIQPRYNQFQEIGFVLEPTTITIQYYLVEGSAGDQVVIIRFDTPVSGIWTIRVYSDLLLYGSYHMWLPISQFIRTGTYFLRPDPDVTVTSPGDTYTCISTAAYNHVSGGIYIQSGRGYTPDGRVVPDLAAPGVNIYGPVPGGGFSTRTGTSVAAAHCCGAAALLLEWAIYRRYNININTNEIKNALIGGATRQSILDYPNRVWGYGALELFNAFQYIST